jgi:hypothetical protein
MLLRIIVVAAMLALAPVGRAAHPFLTEDPGTQGAGRFELELGLAARQGDPAINGREVAFSPQFAIGVTDTVDLIAQAVWLNQKVTDGPTVIGSGDTFLDMKWRFYETEAFALAVRAGLDLPTGEVDDGLGAGKLGGHAIGILGLTFGEYAVYANAGYAYTRTPGARANLGAVSIALTRPDDRPLRGFVEVAAFFQSRSHRFAMAGGRACRRHLYGQHVARRRRRLPGPAQPQRHTRGLARGGHVSLVM